MKIHTVVSGETVSDIAGQYGVSEESIIINNGIEDTKPAVGEELLILIPTRTYTLRRGDSLERLSLRFGVRASDVISMNPGISEFGLTPGKTVTLKYGSRNYGMAAGNGYFYKGCTRDGLMRALPYMTYITVAAGIIDGGKPGYLFDTEETVTIARETGRIPLLRIYIKNQKYGVKEERERLIDTMLRMATSRGCKGITLATEEPEECENFAEFLVETRKRMIGCDLILITEIDESSNTEISEYADGSVLSYLKYAMERPVSFAEGERKVFSDFACIGESAKTFIDLPAIARYNGGFSGTNEALEAARSNRCTVTTDEDTLLSSFVHSKRGVCTYTSLQNIKAILDIINEFGFMGISFDIMRSPVSHLAMYNALFKTASNISVISREGCSRGL